MVKVNIGGVQRIRRLLDWYKGASGLTLYPVQVSYRRVPGIHKWVHEILRVLRDSFTGILESQEGNIEQYLSEAFWYPSVAAFYPSGLPGTEAPLYPTETLCTYLWPLVPICGSLVPPEAPLYPYAYTHLALWLPSGAPFYHCEAPWYPSMAPGTHF